MFNFVGKSLGRYHVVETLGEGEMAAVFKAYDSSLERYVAIKVIRTELGAETEFLKSIHREAKALAQLDHPISSRYWITASRTAPLTWSCRSCRVGL